ncbi:MAG: HEAT repeat domain-containing protein [Phycisphaerae bacterium]|nr:HEAT repeat domain-containing protein [Phycisphaerae bacterium]
MNYDRHNNRRWTIVTMTTWVLLVFAASSWAESRTPSATSSNQREAKPYVEFLKARNIQPSKQDLRRYLKELHPSEAWEKRCKELIDQLASQRWSEREKAARELLSLPRLPIEELQKAETSDDLETRMRAKNILDERDREAVCSSALRSVFKVIRLKKIPGLVKEIRAALPLCGHIYLREAAILAAAVSARPQDAALLRTFLKDDDPYVRRLGVASLAVTLKRSAVSDLQPLLNDKDPQVRQATVKRLTELDVSLPTKSRSSYPPDSLIAEGKFRANEDIPLNLVGWSVPDQKGKRQRLIEIKRIRFENMYGNCWGVFVELAFSASRDHTWRLTAELLDEKDKVLRHPRDRVTRLGIKADPKHGEKRHTIELELKPMHFQGRFFPGRFRLLVQPAPLPIEPGESVVLSAKSSSPKTTPEKKTVFLVGNGYYKWGWLLVSDTKDSCCASLPGLPENNIPVRAFQEGFTQLERSCLEPVSEVLSAELIMAPSQSLGGTVVDEKNLPIAGVAVKLHGRWSRITRTDIQGRWKLDGISVTQTSSLRLSYLQYTNQDWRLGLREGRMEKIQAGKLKSVMVRGFELSGKIIDSTGVPVPGATAIGYFSAGKGWGFQEDYGLLARTDTKGEFRFRNVPTETRPNPWGQGPALQPEIIVVAEAEGYPPAMVRMDVAEKMEPVELKLPRGRDIVCNVVDKDGLPIKDAWSAVDFTMFRLKNGIRVDYECWQQNSNATGRIILRNMPKHGVLLTVGKRGFEVVRDKPIESDKVTVTLQPEPPKVDENPKAGTVRRLGK